jgi:hypothetical protein
MERSRVQIESGKGWSNLTSVHLNKLLRK